MAFNWFDVLLIAALGGGMVQGRRRGMSIEWLALLQWLIILFGCALVYQPVALLISRPGFFSIVSSCLIAYLGATLLLLLGFSWADRHLRPKLVKSDFFGRSEYYLGMASGLLRASCILLVGLALLNARTFTPAEVKQMEAYESSAYGSHVFPSLPTVQSGVFDQSLTGPWIKDKLGFLLIHSTTNQLASSR